MWFGTKRLETWSPVTIKGPFYLSLVKNKNKRNGTKRQQIEKTKETER